MKICTKCKLEKYDNEFHKTGTQCKECKSLYNKKFYQNNIDSFKSAQVIYISNNKQTISAAAKIYHKIYNINNKQKLKVKKSIYYQNNKKKKSLYAKEYYLKNKEAIDLHQKEYSENNKDKINKRQSLRSSKDESYKLRIYVSHAIYIALRKNLSSKNNHSIMEYLPYSIQELKIHIASQFIGWDSWMNWNNWGKYNVKIWNDDDCETWTWNIDHIIPQSDLLYTSMEDENFKKCWSLENLRAYSAKQNHRDGTTRIRHKQDTYSTNNIIESIK